MGRRGFARPRNGDTITQGSWKLFHEAKAGGLAIMGGNMTGFHIANVKISDDAPEITNFTEREHTTIEGAIASWEISNKFEEKALADPEKIEKLIASRKWQEYYYSGGF